MKDGWFVTGTDTGVGKTVVAAGLILALVQRQVTAVGMKPVASGCVNNGAGWRNADAELLISVANVDVRYEAVNPYAFEAPVAPHLAAQDAGIEINKDKIFSCLHKLSSMADYAIIEGVGGWSVPISETCTMEEVAKGLGLPVILVVGMRLGCLNHAALTAAAIANSGCRLRAWVANQIDPDFQLLDRNISSLDNLLSVPCIGVLPWQPHGCSPSVVAETLDLATLLDSRGG